MAVIEHNNRLNNIVRNMGKQKVQTFCGQVGQFSLWDGWMREAPTVVFGLFYQCSFVPYYTDTNPAVNATTYCGYSIFFDTMDEDPSASEPPQYIPVLTTEQYGLVDHDLWKGTRVFFHFWLDKECEWDVGMEEPPKGVYVFDRRGFRDLKHDLKNSGVWEEIHERDTEE